MEIRIDGTGVFIDGKPCTPRVVRPGEDVPNDGMPYLLAPTPSLSAIPSGLRLGMRVKLSDQGWSKGLVRSREERACAAETVVVHLEGPLTDGPNPAYAVEVAGALSPYLWTDEDWEPA